MKPNRVANDSHLSTTTTSPTPDLARRRFLRGCGYFAVALPAMAAHNLVAADSDLPALDPSSEIAVGLNYVVDATKSQRSDDTHACRSCHHFIGDRSGTTGGCNIFQQFSVVADGWCSGFIPAPT